MRYLFRRRDTYLEAEKDIIASNPPKSWDFGGFSRFLAFSQPWGLRIQSAEKKISFQKNGFLQDVEQLSPAAKAQYPFLRAESATFRVAKAFCAASALFSYFYLLNICVCPKEGSSSVTFIKKKIATAATAAVQNMKKTAHLCRRGTSIFFMLLLCFCKNTKPFSHLRWALSVIWESRHKSVLFFAGKLLHVQI